MIVESLSDNLVATRDALHQVAFFALAPARHRVEGRMGLRPTLDGFGTPEFDGRVARLEGDLLVHETPEGVATRTITTVRDAAEFFGGVYQVDWYATFKDPLEPADPDTELAVDIESTRSIAEWFGAGAVVLARLSAVVAAHGEEASEVQLWPEHFDLATEIGPETSRASYGFSPGDRGHELPYLYVSAWGEIDRSNPFWNDPHFNGASLAYSQLFGGPLSPEETAFQFLHEGFRLLNGGEE